jgi:RHS repeat-associated protein
MNVSKASEDPMVWDPLDKLEKLTSGGSWRYLYSHEGERTVIIRPDDAGGPSSNPITLYFRDLGGRLLSEFEAPPSCAGGCTGTEYADWLADGAGWARDYVHAEDEHLVTVQRDQGTPSAEVRRSYWRDPWNITRIVSLSEGLERNYDDPKDRDLFLMPFGNHGFDNFQTSFDPRDHALRYANHERDTNTDGNAQDEADYMHSRYYIADRGRFQSVDPINSGDPSVPQSWNKYAYALNNPVSFHDPDGRFALGIIKKGLKLAIKGGDLGATFGGLISDVKTVFNGDASGTDRVLAGLSAASEIFSPVSARDAKAVGAAAVGLAAKGRQSSRLNTLSPEAGALGAHTVFKTDAAGRVSGYTTFDVDGNATKRFRGSGRPHGGVEPPLILEPKAGKGPGSRPKVPRKPREDELPRGY